MVCRPTGIRTPTDGTKNQSATVTPWVCFILVVQIYNFFLYRQESPIKSKEFLSGEKVNDYVLMS